MAAVYNVNSNATQVLASKLIKENIFAKLLHRDGKGITEHYEVNASSIRIFRVVPNGNQGRELGNATNGGFFNNKSAQITQVTEHDLNLLFIVDRPIDIPEVQQDMVAVDVLENTMKNHAGEVALEINASTLGIQLSEVFNEVYAMTTPAWTGKAVVLASTPDYLGSFMDASSLLDEGDSSLGIQSFPFENRQALLTTTYRQGLMKKGQIIVGGSDIAQSMLAKGALSPDANKDFGDFYIGEVDLIPCYLCPKAVLDEAGTWFGSSSAFDSVKAVLLAGMATDRGISGQGYVKIIDSPTGAGFRLQPKTRWGVEVYSKRGIIPILAYNTSVPAAKLTIAPPENS